MPEKRIQLVKDFFAKKASDKMKLILSLCDERSPIERQFLAHLYSFFCINGFTIKDISIEPSSAEEISKSGSTTNIDYVFYWPYNKTHKIRLDPTIGFHIDTNIKDVDLPLLLIGFKIIRAHVVYEVYPQYPITEDGINFRVIDFVIKAKSRTGKLIHNFAIECDGHEFHSTKEQLQKDNIRSRFLTKHDFRIIRYNGKEIFNMTDQTIIDLENVMFQCMFKIKSDLHKSHKYGI